MSDQSSVVDVREEINALLNQEKHYQCADYLGIHAAARQQQQLEFQLQQLHKQQQQQHNQPHHQQQQQVATVYATVSSEEPDLVHMLEEFANVVTDKSFVSKVTRSSENNSNEESTKTSSSHNNNNSNVSMMKNSPSIASLHDVREVHRLNTSSSFHSSFSATTGTSTTNSCTSPQPVVCPSVPPRDFLFWRQQMFDWACLVVDSFSIEREVVAVAFDLLDRFVAKEEQRTANTYPIHLRLVITRDDFQLFCMTCLYLAVKLLEPYPRKISIAALVEMSRGFYTKADITVTESEILEALEWHVNPPTALAFSRLYWQLFPMEAQPLLSHTVKLTCTCLTEIALTDGFFVPCKASNVALAAVVHAARADGMAERHIHQFLSNLQAVTTTTTTTPVEETNHHQQQPASSSSDAAFDFSSSSSNLFSGENTEVHAVYRQLEMLYNQ